jgi:hypothetical protein
VTETERIANEVYNRYSRLHRCWTKGCNTLVSGQAFCPRCKEELDGEPYSLANVLRTSRAAEWVCCALLAIEIVLLAILVALWCLYYF